jgi:hypothetical protein
MELFLIRLNILVEEEDCEERTEEVEIEEGGRRER